MDIQVAVKLANDLMAEHGLLWKNWTFKLDNAQCRCGYCCYSKRTISLSRSYITLNREELVRDTILHEIAHALLGPGFGHGQAWKLKAISVGAKPYTCREAKRDGLVSPETDYYSICDKCGHKSPCHRRPRFRGREYFHTPCGRKTKIVWYYKGKQLDNFGNPVLPAPVIKAATALFIPEQKAADQPKPEVASTRPTQAQILELWARLDRLEGK